MRRPTLSLLPRALLAAALASLLLAAIATAQQPNPSPSFPSPFGRTVPVAPGFPFARSPQPGATPNVAATPVPLTSPTSLAAAADIIHRGQGSLVIVEGREAAGSGFICELEGQKYLVTNAHVMAGNTQVNFTLLDGMPVRVGAAGSAIGHDMLRLAVAPDLPAFSVLDRVNENLLVGDEVVVLGNEKGARVITPLSGKVVGLGPNLVEVDAPFQPGNSGSPIIQVKTGKVVAIATFVRQERDEDAERNRPAPRPIDPRYGPSAETYQPIIKLRRFGYRLDSVKGWQPVAWQEFEAEAATMKKVAGRTKDILALIKDINEHHGHLTPGVHFEPAIQGPEQEFFDAMSQRPSPSDALAARQQLLDSLRRACQSDLADLQPRLRYDYFQREFTETQRSRDALAKSFDEALKAQANNTGR